MYLESFRNIFLVGEGDAVANDELRLVFWNLSILLSFKVGNVEGRHLSRRLRNVKLLPQRRV